MRSFILSIILFFGLSYTVFSKSSNAATQYDQYPGEYNQNTYQYPHESRSNTNGYPDESQKNVCSYQDKKISELTEMNNLLQNKINLLQEKINRLEGGNNK